MRPCQAILPFALLTSTPPRHFPHCPVSPIAPPPSTASVHSGSTVSTLPVPLTTSPVPLHPVNPIPEPGNRHPVLGDRQGHRQGQLPTLRLLCQLQQQSTPSRFQQAGLSDLPRARASVKVTSSPVVMRILSYTPCLVEFQVLDHSLYVTW